MIARTMRIVYNMRFRYPLSGAAKHSPVSVGPDRPRRRGRFHDRCTRVWLGLDTEHHRKDASMSGEKDKVTGRMKQAAGDLTGDDDLEREGEREEAAGKLKDKVDDVKDRANDAIDDVKERFDGS